MTRKDAKSIIIKRKKIRLEIKRLENKLWKSSVKAEVREPIRAELNKLCTELVGLKKDAVEAFKALI